MGDLSQSNASQDVGFEQWMLLLELTTNLMVATDALVGGLQGKLGVETRAEAVVESERRVREYQTARNAVIRYARSCEAAMS